MKIGKIFSVPIVHDHVYPPNLREKYVDAQRVPRARKSCVSSVYLPEVTVYLARLNRLDSRVISCETS